MNIIEKEIGRKRRIEGEFKNFDELKSFLETCGNEFRESRFGMETAESAIFSPDKLYKEQLESTLEDVRKFYRDEVRGVLENYLEEELGIEDESIFSEKDLEDRSFYYILKTGHREIGHYHSEFYLKDRTGYRFDVPLGNRKVKVVRDVESLLKKSDHTNRTRIITPDGKRVYEGEGLKEELET